MTLHICHDSVFLVFSNPPTSQVHERFRTHPTAEHEYVVAFNAIIVEKIVCQLVTKSKGSTSIWALHKMTLRR